jgi:hypothetical protein
MSTVVEIEPQVIDLDPVFSKLSDAHGKLARRANEWNRCKGKYLKFVQEMILLGCELSTDSDFDFHFRVAGDKQKFLQLVRCHRRHGFKPDMPEKGATSAFWRINERSDQIGMYLSFSSTVCHRVKVGTKMVEQDVYETQCESIVPDEEPQLQGPTPVVAMLSSSAPDDVPF